MLHPVAGLLVAVLIAFPAASMAQAIPDHIPDNPDESPADRRRERIEERFRPSLSRVFVSNKIAFAPGPGFGAGIFDYEVQVGSIRISGDAIYASVGQRWQSLAGVEQPRFSDQLESALRVTAHYELRLRRVLGDVAMADRMVLGFGAGALLGDVAGVVVEITPAYIFFPRSRWSIPLGLKVGAMFPTGAHEGWARYFIGPSIAGRLHLGHRESLR